MWPRIALEYALIAATLVVASKWPHPLLLWAAAIFIGSRQHALAIIGHWAVHKLMPAHKLAQWLCFAPAGVDPARYRQAHFAHHRAVGSLVYDVEAGIAHRFASRWSKPRRADLVLDAVGMHADEMLAIFKTLTSMRAAVVYAAFMAALVLAFGWVALLWPLASGTGVMLCQRLRARTEHDHINAPGRLIVTPKPSLLARIAYLPHFTWLHAEHHTEPARKVWQ